jgi:hypothetical protein
MTAITATQATSHISPANERIYHQSNLLGTWSGTWTKGHQPVSFKVVSINGSTAQVEYTHNGHTERGTGTVNGSTVTYGDVTVGTRDGSNAALVFSYGNATQSAVLQKAADTTQQNKLVGSWIGSTATQSVTFKVGSITGRDAQVKYTSNGQTTQGTGDLYQNTVTFGGAQVTSIDGVHGTVIYKSGHQTLSLAVTKFVPNTTTTSTVNKIA